MSPSELLRRRDNPHQQLNQREDDQNDESGSGGDENPNDNSDEGNDGNNNEDQPSNEAENNEETTATTTEIHFVAATEYTTMKPSDIPTSSFRSGRQTSIRIFPPPPDTPPDNFETWSQTDESSHTGKRSSFTEIISTSYLLHGNAPESTAVSSQEHATKTYALQTVVASRMTDDDKKARSAYYSSLSPFGLRNRTSLIGKRSMSSNFGLISLKDDSDEDTLDSTSDVSNDDSTSSTMVYVYPFPRCLSPLKANNRANHEDGNLSRIVPASLLRSKRVQRLSLKARRQPRLDFNKERRSLKVVAAEAHLLRLFRHQSLFGRTVERLAHLTPPACHQRRPPEAIRIPPLTR